MKPFVQSLHRLLSLISAKIVAVGSHDFLPWTNRFTAWLRRPIGWLVIAMIASALAGASVAPQAFLICAVIFVVLSTGIVWPWLSMRGLSAELTFKQRRCTESDQVIVYLTVRNRWPWPVWGLLVEGGFFSASDERAKKAATALSRVPSWSRTRFEFIYQPPRRAIVPHKPPKLSTGFPFGISTSSKAIDVNEKLIVWPRPDDLNRSDSIVGDQKSIDGELFDRPGPEGDVIASRPYQQGDTQRQVHWIHTARRGSLIVCERQSSSRRSICVLLDPKAFDSELLNDESNWDWSLRVVAGLCRQFHHQGWSLECVLNGERFTVVQSADGLKKLFDRLAAFEPNSESTSAHLTTLKGSASHGRMTIVVTSTSRWDSDANEFQANVRQSQVRSVVLNSTPARQTMNRRLDALSDHPPKPWIELEPTEQLIGVGG